MNDTCNSIKISAVIITFINENMGQTIQRKIKIKYGIAK